MYRVQQKSLSEQLESVLESKDTGRQFNDGIDHLKQQLINYIYNTVDISRFKYELLQFDNELHQLVEKKFYVSANFSGSNCLLVFTKIRDKYHSFLIDRKTLSYNSQKVNIRNVKISNIHVKLDLEIYNGTIFDGIYVQNKTEKTFIITDIYMFKNQDFTKSQLNSKLLTLRTYLQYNYNENNKDNDIVLMVNKLFPLDQTEHIVNNIIPKIKGFIIRGICFYPEVSSTKLIYLFGNETRNEQSNMTIDKSYGFIKTSNEKHNEQSNITIDKSYEFIKTSNDNKISSYIERPLSPASTNSSKLNSKFDNTEQLTPQINKSNTKTIYLPKKGKSDEIYVFEMKKTDNVDVYHLNIVEPIQNGSKTRLKRIKIGLALIPNVTRSKWCKEVLDNIDTDEKVLVNCKFHSDKNKWEPILLSKSTRPSLTDDFDIKYED